MEVSSVQWSNAQQKYSIRDCRGIWPGGRRNRGKQKTKTFDFKNRNINTRYFKNLMLYLFKFFKSFIRV